MHRSAYEPCKYNCSSLIDWSYSRIQNFPGTSDRLFKVNVCSGLQAFWGLNKQTFIWVWPSLPSENTSNCRIFFKCMGDKLFAFQWHEPFVCSLVSESIIWMLKRVLLQCKVHLNTSLPIESNWASKLVRAVAIFRSYDWILCFY